MARRQERDEFVRVRPRVQQSGGCWRCSGGARRVLYEQTERRREDWWWWSPASALRPAFFPLRTIHTYCGCKILRSLFSARSPLATPTNQHKPQVAVASQLLTHGQPRRRRPTDPLPAVTQPQRPAAARSPRSYMRCLFAIPSTDLR